MRLAHLLLTCGTTLSLVSHVGSKVNVSCPCIGLQEVELQGLCSDRRACLNGCHDEGCDGEQMSIWSWWMVSIRPTHAIHASPSYLNRSK